MERPIWHAAAEFASRKHHGQLRKDRVTPYFSHRCRVALTVAAVFGFEDDETLAAALLHDTLEDKLTHYDDLAEAFGPAVTEMVAALADNKALPGAERQLAVLSPPLLHAPDPRRAHGEHLGDKLRRQPAIACAQNTLAKIL